MSLIKLQMFDGVKCTFDIFYEISFLIPIIFWIFYLFLSIMWCW